MKSVCYILLAVLVNNNIGHYSVEATRNGITLNGTGYLVYSSNIPANTSLLLVTGSFSTRNNASDQVIIATEDKDGNFQFMLIVTKHGCIRSISNHGSGQHCSSPPLNDGLSYNFRTKLVMKMVTDKNGTKEVEHQSETVISQWSTRSSNKHISMTKRWNFEKVKLYIGGYRQSIYNSSSQLSGCLSDVVIYETHQGTNVITAYFSQSLKHTNPTAIGGPLPDKAGVCHIIPKTTPAPATSPSTNKQPRGDATGLLPILNIVITFFFMACISINQ